LEITFNKYSKKSEGLHRARSVRNQYLVEQLFCFLKNLTQPTDCVFGIVSNSQTEFGANRITISIASIGTIGSNI